MCRYLYIVLVHYSYIIVMYYISIYKYICIHMCMCIYVHVGIESSAAGISERDAEGRLGEPAGVLGIRPRP